MQGGDGAHCSTARRSDAILLASAALVYASPAFAALKSSVHNVRVITEAAQLEGETVNERIQTLRETLAITTCQESDWQKVADVVRDNDAKIVNIVCARTGGPNTRIATADDPILARFLNEAHVAGLRDLIAVFQTLYDSMTNSQKMIADKVFRGFGPDRSLRG